MISIQNTSGKTCVYCGEDCADRPRIRDPKGRYSCQACLERVNRNREVRERAVAGWRGTAAGAPTVTLDPALKATKHSLLTTNGYKP